MAANSHLMAGDQGASPPTQFAPGNAEDRSTALQKATCLRGMLVCDRAYLSHALLERLYAQGLQPIAPARKYRLVALDDNLLTRKRLVIEIIADLRRKVLLIERSFLGRTTNFGATLIGGLNACTWQARKTSL